MFEMRSSSGRTRKTSDFSSLISPFPLRAFLLRNWPPAANSRSENNARCQVRCSRCEVRAGGGASSLRKFRGFGNSRVIVSMREEKAQDLLERTRIFAEETLKLCNDLPRGAEVGLLKRQLLRAATSVGANYRAARRARSRKDFVAKLSLVEEEADECVYWFDLLKTLRVSPPNELRFLRSEADQLVAIIVAYKKTALRKGL